MWKEYRLGDLADLVTKGTTPSSMGGGFVDSGVNFIKSEAVSYDGRLDRSTFVHITEEMHHKLKRSQLAKNDILYSMAGIFLGKNALVPEDVLPANTNQALAIIRLNQKKALPKFVHYYLRQQSVIDFVNNMSGQSAQPNINFEEIRGIPITLPDLSEQIAIAEILSSFDDKIDLLHHQNKTLEQMSETLWRQWFVEDTDESWEIGKVEDVISVQGGTTPSTANAEFWDGNIHWTSPRDLSNTASIFMFDTGRKITEKGLKKIGSGLLPVGSVLLSSRAPIGYLSITEIPVAINQGYIGIICNKNVSNYFIYLWCKVNMETIENAGNGSVFQEISKASFKSLDILIPSKEKLTQFDERVSPLFQKIKQNSLQLLQITAMRDLLLPKLMNGEVIVKDNG
jgi:type I restriction enzyme, S subunit